MGVRGPISAQQREDLRRIQLSQRHLLLLINEVLNYTSLEQGTTRFNLTTVGVRDALVEAEGVIAPQVRAKVLFLSLGDVRRDLVVTADVEKVREILTNLLSNAVKFTGAGGRVDVDLRRHPDRSAHSSARHRHRYSGGQARRHLRAVRPGARRSRRARSKAPDSASRSAARSRAVRAAILASRASSVRDRRSRSRLPRAKKST